MTSQVLTSWKEIAAYLGKGVRTVQRWEAQLGLPVRRPGPERHIVLAFPAELDEWALNSQLRLKAPGNTLHKIRRSGSAHEDIITPIIEHVATLAELRKDLQRTAAKQRRLRQQMQELRERLAAQRRSASRARSG